MRLTFADAAHAQPVDDALGNRQSPTGFDVPAKQSRTFAWRIKFPTASAHDLQGRRRDRAGLSDGEEGVSCRCCRGRCWSPNRCRCRSAARRRRPSTSPSSASRATPQRAEPVLTVQMVSQPAWYAVMALPYLMEYPYECSEQTFNRLYANALARHIANSDPKIRRIFDQWKGTPALDSPLEKNQDLKSVMLEETPWLRQAVRRKPGPPERRHPLRRQPARQRDGADAPRSWPTCSTATASGPGSRRPRQRLHHASTSPPASAGCATSAWRWTSRPAIKALGGLDAWMTDRYHEIRRRPDPEETIPRTSTPSISMAAVSS